MLSEQELLEMERPVSARHAPMRRCDRAAQFAEKIMDCQQPCTFDTGFFRRFQCAAQCSNFSFQRRQNQIAGLEQSAGVGNLCSVREAQFSLQSLHHQRKLMCCALVQSNRFCVAFLSSLRRKTLKCGNFVAVRRIFPYNEINKVHIIGKPKLLPHDFIQSAFCRLSLIHI